MPAAQVVEVITRKTAGTVFEHAEKPMARRVSATPVVTDRLSADCRQASVADCLKQPAISYTPHMPCTVFWSDQIQRRLP